jgi:DNA/RNA-binding domain of Phe-tRNA-synthetase-like protein
MIKVNQKIWDNHIGLKIGVLVVKNCNNTRVSQEIMNLIKEYQEIIKGNYASETLSQEPKINAWRKAYFSFGAKPKEHKSSVENLYKMVLNRVELRHINKIVDIYNYISLKYMLPVGGEDLDKIKGEIELTYVGEREKPILLLGDKEPKTPKPGEVIYKDEEGAICRRFNWREADRTKLTEETKNVVLVVECLPPADESELNAALIEIKELSKKYCGGEVHSFVLKEKNIK